MLTGEKREGFFCLMFGQPQSHEGPYGEVSIIPLHSPHGETEAQNQPSTSQHCLAGESQCSLNPTSYRVQRQSQVGTIPRAGSLERQSATDVAKVWMGAALGGAGSPWGNQPWGVLLLTCHSLTKVSFFLWWGQCWDHHGSNECSQAAVTAN